LDEVSVLDLFSGSGNISYEFASRGVNAITAVEIHAGCTQFITEVAEKLEMPIEVIKSDVYTYLQKTPKKFDIIFADPPYALPLEEFQQITKLVFEKELILEGGVLVIEHEKHMDLSETPNFREARRYGSSVFSFFEK
jgi:16S rRNA (guanine(966)-N(2))-methyltransferase RsmD